MSSLTVPMASLSVGDVNNIRDTNNNNAKKSLVKMTNREGSTRSLSCFKNPELSSLELPLSEEMTFDMYRTNIESIRDPERKRNNLETDERDRLVGEESVEHETERRSSTTNGAVDQSTSAVENLKLSGVIEDDEETIRVGRGTNATKRLKEKLDKYAEEMSYKITDFKRSDAFDEGSINSFKGSSGVNQSSGTKQSVKTDEREVYNIANKESNERPLIIDKFSERPTNINKLSEKAMNNSKISVNNELEEEIIQVKQKRSQGANKNGFRNGDKNEVVLITQTSKKDRMLGPSEGDAAMGSSKDPTLGSSTVSKRLTIVKGEYSVKKMKEQFDSVDSNETIQSRMNESLGATEAAGRRTNNLLEMKKSPPPHKQWKENVEVPLGTPKTGKEENSNSRVDREDGQGIGQSSSSPEINDVRVRSQNQPKLKQSRKPWESVEDDLVNGDLAGVNIKTESSLAGNVGEKREYFSTLEKKQESKYDVRGGNPRMKAGLVKSSFQNLGPHAVVRVTDQNGIQLASKHRMSEPDEYVSLNANEKENHKESDLNLAGKVGEKREYFSSLEKREDPKYDTRGWSVSNGTSRPKHLEFFESFDRDQESSHKNLRGRTSANRRKIDRQDASNLLWDKDFNRTVNGAKSALQETPKFNASSQKSPQHLNENSDSYYIASDRSQIHEQDFHANGNFKSANGLGTLWSIPPPGEYDRVIETRSSRAINGGLSPASEDWESTGEYEIQPQSRSGRTEVPSENAIQRMIEDKNKEPSHLEFQNFQNSQPPRDTNGSEFSKYKSDDSNFYEQLDDQLQSDSYYDSYNEATSTAGNTKIVKKPRGPGPDSGHIWLEQHEGRRTGDSPVPTPMRDEEVYNIDDDNDHLSNNDDAYEDESNDENASVQTIITTTTRHVKQTIPAGVVTVARDEEKKMASEKKISGSITASKTKRTAEKNLISGFIDVENEASQPVQVQPRREVDIEVVTMNNRTSAAQQPEIRGRPSHEVRRGDLVRAHPQHHEGFTRVYNERAIASPSVIDTEISLDPELRDAHSSGGTYRITVNLNKSLFASSRPPSALHNSSFSSPSFSPQHVSRYTSSTSHDSNSNIYNNGYDTMSSFAPSVFSPPIQPPSFRPTFSGPEQTRTSGSGKVIVSIDGTPNSVQQVPSQNDVTFSLSLQGNKPQQAPPTATTNSVSSLKVTHMNNRAGFSGQEVEERVEKKTILSKAPRFVTDDSSMTHRKVTSTLERSSRSVPRKLASENHASKSAKSPENNLTRPLQRSGRRQEVLFSALDVRPILKEEETKKSEGAHKVVRLPEFASNKQDAILAKDCHQSSEVTTRGGTQTWKSEFRSESKAAVDSGFVARIKNPLKSLEEEGDFDREIEINKKVYSKRGVSSERRNVESFSRQEAGCSISASSGVRRIEQINKFDLQALLRGAAADSVKQRINVKRMGDKLSSGPKISEDMRNSMTRDELPPSENDKVAEEISMNIDSGKVTMTSEILCEKTVPIYNSQDMYKTSSILLTRVIEVDLSVTPERKRLYELLVGPNIQERPLSDGEKKELYNKFMALAEQSRRGLF